MPSLLPQVLPWLGILALLLLKPNRCASAWWIWLPLALVAGVGCLPQWAVDALPSEQLDVLLEMISALGFGLAAVWLLASYLGWKHRMLTLLGMLLAQGGFSLLAFAIRQDWQGVGPETFAVGIMVAATTLTLAVGMTLAGLVCRGRYGKLRLTLWLIVALAVLWALILAPFFVFALMANGRNVPIWVFFMALATAVGLAFGMVLPFLVLSFVNGFYRERLKGLLHFGKVETPPRITPPLPAEPAPAGGGS